MTNVRGAIPKMLKLSEVAQTMRVQVSTVRTWIDRGELVASSASSTSDKTAARAIRVHPDELAAFIERRRVKPMARPRKRPRVTTNYLGFRDEGPATAKS